MSTQTEEFQPVTGPIPINTSVVSVLGYNPSNIPAEFKKIAVLDPHALAGQSLAEREILNSTDEVDEAREKRIEDLLKMAAVSGLPASLYWLAITLNYTEGGDPEKAQKLLKQAAIAGYGPAEFQLFAVFDRQARIDETNPRIPYWSESKARAQYWLKRAAESRYPNALLVRGLHVDKYDRQKATALFLDAALQGYAPAQMRLSRRFEYGHGTEKDLRAAAYWRLQAALQENDEAISFLLEMGDLFPENGVTDPKALELIEDIVAFLELPEITEYVADLETARREAAYRLANNGSGEIAERALENT